jgi:ABC-type phosphate transport system substrate-binding protein
MALGSVCTLALMTPSLSQAGFTSPYTTQCSGAESTGITTGLQSDIAKTWDLQFAFEDTTSPLACVGSSSQLNFISSTNATALADLGAEDGQRNPRFRSAGAEEPPTLSQWLKIDLGDKPGEDSGLIRQVPVAATAVVPVVRFPDGCAIPSKEATTDGRFTVPNSLLEKVYAGKIATWGQLLPDIQASCASIPIVRVVPASSDGTTFVFKQWLATVDPGLGWEESSTLPNSAWPNDSGATATLRSEGGDSGEAEVVAETSGSIGFASLDKARNNGFGYFSPENPFHEFQNGDQFWLSVRNGAGQQVEPTRDPRSGVDNVLGANCDNPQFNYTPSGYDTTATPVWRYVSAAGSRTGWPICTLSYDLAWDDSSTVYGSTAEVQATQRTVKDYLAYALGSAGQAEAKAADYSPLPPALLADAKDGQSRVGWSKTPGSKSNAIKSQIAAAAAHATH